MKEKRIIIAVTNDLVADQRVHRTASTLARNGAYVLVVGRRLPGSQTIRGRSYPVHRMRLLFRRGPIFYACFNLRLLIFLLFRKADLLVSNDLDTLMACFLASRFKGRALVYDSHEYFTEVPELLGRHFTQRIWKWIEKLCLPGVKFSLTVSHSIADAYHLQYGVNMEVIRNLPIHETKLARRPDLLFCNPKRIIIYQGALNPGRGLEGMITSMQYLDKFQFQIFGEGDIRKKLEELVRQLDIEDRVVFMGRLPFDELKEYTRQASLGVSLEEDMGLNYRYALPNKLFDYIQARVPVLVSDLPEMKKIVEDNYIGEVLRDPDPELLAQQVKEMMNSHELRIKWKKNLRKAANDLCWEKEEKKLLHLFSDALSG